MTNQQGCSDLLCVRDACAPCCEPKVLSPLPFSPPRPSPLLPIPPPLSSPLSALLYQVLYNKVFHEDTPSSASISKLVERPPPSPSPSSPSPSAQGGAAEVASDTDRQSTQFSRCLLESLAESHYRNIAMEVYQSSKQGVREQDWSPLGGLGASSVGEQG